MKFNPLSLSTALVAVLFCSAREACAQAQPPVEQQKPKWESTLAAGLTLTRGNSDTVLATASATTARKWDHNELSLGADGVYGESKIKQSGSTENKPTRTADSLHGFAQYNRLFTERLYGYGRVEGLHDEIADVKYRVSLSPGAGYYFIKDKTSDLSAELGPGFILQRLGSIDQRYATLRVGEKFHYALSDRARVWQTAEFLPQVDDFNNYIINAEIGIEADLTQDKRFTLRCFLQDTYNNKPALISNSPPAYRQKNDAKLVSAIAYKF